MLNCGSEGRALIATAATATIAGKGAAIRSVAVRCHLPPGPAKPGAGRQQQANHQGCTKGNGEG
jgi:hypothetical protein